MIKPNTLFILTLQCDKNLVNIIRYGSSFVAMDIQSKIDLFESVNECVRRNESCW